MPEKGDLAILQDPAAQELLRSTIPARLAFTTSRGEPRVMPIWFHWNGREIVVATRQQAPKVNALSRNPMVALIIDTETWPNVVLTIRGTAKIEMTPGPAPEYVEAARRYTGSVEAGDAWVARSAADGQARIVITPEWADLLDFRKFV